MGSRPGWAGYDQPTLASTQVPADVWEAGRLPAEPMPLTDEVSTAAALVHAGGCSPQCLISAGVPAKQCDCACRGAYHGVLSDADIPSALRHREAATDA
ncbi:hypothetical protein AB0N38_10645 [Micromonospora aurantiaca]|uniref:hypothetical protein n=1 Tax=Micromonospora aurantiaca (nom. illeg.) TaxID=47850 RepID=UPI003423466F